MENLKPLLEILLATSSILVILWKPVMIWSLSFHCCSWDFIYAEYVMAAGNHHRSIVWQVTYCFYRIPFPSCTNCPISVSISLVLVTFCQCLLCLICSGHNSNIFSHIFILLYPKFQLSQLITQGVENTQYSDFTVKPIVNDSSSQEFIWNLRWLYFFCVPALFWHSGFTLLIWNMIWCDFSSTKFAYALEIITDSRGLLSLWIPNPPPRILPKYVGSYTASRRISLCFLSHFHIWCRNIVWLLSKY
jgi:hypothetical protein